LTHKQRNTIQNPAEGLMVYQTDSTRGFWYFNGQSWQNIDIDKGCSGVKVFEYTGSEQTFIIPECANELLIECWGAEGQAGGGFGGYCSGRYYLNGETSLLVYVGGKNGYNGGGIGINPVSFLSQNGGGASDVRLQSDLNSRLIVAGGGGSGFQVLYFIGGNTFYNVNGGDGGSCNNNFWVMNGEAGQEAFTSTSNNTNNCNKPSSTGNSGNGQNYWAVGSGGTDIGGIGACIGSPCTATNGQLGIGGNGNAGGGGGYYGGGGASAFGTNASISASAGGGSSWVGGCEPPYNFMGGIRQGNGRVRITWH
jgi:hypothetical protein